MSGAEVTRDGQVGMRPGREAQIGAHGTTQQADEGRRRGRGRGEQLMVPPATAQSYYGMPVLNKPVWEARDIAGYLFTGGLASASSIIAAGAEFTGRRTLARAGKLTGLGAIAVSAGLLIHDLGRPERFYNMLRVVKLTSPMSVGTWILSAYGPLAGGAAVTEVTGLFPRLGRVLTAAAGFMAPPVAAYTAVLIADTAVPAWHEAHRELPFVFVSSAALAGAGMGLVAAPIRETAPVRRAAVFAAAAELFASRKMESHGLVSEPYSIGKAGRLLAGARALSVAGAVGAAVFGGRSRAAAVASGAALLAGSVCTRFGIFHAGITSAEDPKYVLAPQRERVNERANPTR